MQAEAIRLALADAGLEPLAARRRLRPGLLRPADADARHEPDRISRHSSALREQLRYRRDRRVHVDGRRRDRGHGSRPVRRRGLRLRRQRVDAPYRRRTRLHLAGRVRDRGLRGPVRLDAGLVVRNGVAPLSRPLRPRPESIRSGRWRSRCERTPGATRTRPIASRSRWTITAARRWWPTRSAGSTARLSSTAPARSSSPPSGSSRRTSRATYRSRCSA